MPQWQYRKIDLSSHDPRGDGIDLLNAAGRDGWELVIITSNHIAYLKRPVVEAAATRKAVVPVQKRTPAGTG
ncbi:MAG TPA: hypothetical protein VFA64_04905 [Hyphomicrobiaceae bacterium]|nr:hypothetical protein [Hyphomicrobiaceae bacterium]